MLNANDTVLFLQAAEALRTCKCGAGAAAEATLAELIAALTASARQRAAMAESALARPKRGKPGRPGSIYAVEFGSLWSGHAEGMPQAAAMVNETLREHGLHEVTTQAIHVAVARHGGWAKVVATDNGDHALTVRKRKEPTTEAAEPAPPAVPHDPKKLAHVKPKRTGTKRASVQSEHETETNPETDAALRKRLSGR